MQGDFSRWTFNPDNHFTRVLMQQGRVQLDADWNEQVAILLHTIRQMVSDMMGPHGTWDKDAFKVNDNATALEKGKYYVGGWLIEATQSNELDRKDFSGHTLVYLDVWERHLTYLEADEANKPGLREVALKGADTTTRAKIAWQIRTNPISFPVIESNKTSLVLLKEKQQRYAALRQALPTPFGWPDSFDQFTTLVTQLNKVVNAFDKNAAGADDTTKQLPPSPAATGVYQKTVIDPIIVVIKALQALNPDNESATIAALRTELNRVIDAFDKNANGIDDTNKQIPTSPAAIEVYPKTVIDPIITVIKALQGLSPLNNGTSADEIITRLIKEHQLKQLEQEIKDDKIQIETNINTTFNQLDTAGQLNAQTGDASSSTETDSCTIPPDAAYTGPENQLYRVEIHQGGDKDAATFKWSRENGTVIFLVDPKSITISENTVTLIVENLGRDTEASLAPDNWVELTNDDLAQKLIPGLMFQIESIDPVTGLVKLRKGTLPAEPKLPDKNAGHPILRRWDHKSDPTKNGEDMISGAMKVVEDSGDVNGWFTLENGIQIQFQKPVSGSNNYRTGDYWLIPARTATRDIEWPKKDDGDPKAIPPHGIQHYYAPLAIIDAEGGVIDCRRVFEQLGKPVLPEPVTPSEQGQ